MPTDGATRMRCYLEAEIARLSAIIRLPPQDVPGFVNCDGGRPFLVVEDTGLLRERAFERGRPVLDRDTNDPDELLYWAFATATFSFGMRLALMHPVGSEQQRVTLWRHQALLLHVLHPSWQERWRKELAQSLRNPADRDRIPALPAQSLDFYPPGFW
jgi:hypothetical protein